MRALDQAFQARLDGGATTLCRCWLVIRSDGAAFGFTDHDEDVAFDGQVFLANSGMTAQAIERTTGLSIDNAEAVGALSAAGLSEADLRAGLFDGAAVQHWLVDWSDPAARVLEFRGTLGEIRQAAGAFEVELRGAAEALNQPVGRAYQGTCEQALGDAKCGVDTTDPAFAASVTVTEVLGPRLVVVSDLSAYAEDWFTHGSALWSGGANAGRSGQVKLDLVLGTDRRLEFWRDPAFAIAVGDTLDVVAGCDKAAATCRAKFSNFLNFRGFPHIPGDDWVTAYPATGAVHDGASLLTPG